MLIALLAITVGLVLLVWSADRFVDGSATVARHFGMPPLLIGMVIVGFGTSAPEMVVSALAAGQGAPGLALGPCPSMSTQTTRVPRAAISGARRANIRLFISSP